MEFNSKDPNGALETLMCASLSSSSRLFLALRPKIVVGMVFMPAKLSLV
jgi:hypothetical protein